MQVSAINFNNSFKGETIEPEVIDASYSMRNPNEIDKLDRVDFRKVASAIDNNTEATKHTSPIRFFLVSTALAAASLVAFRAAAFGVLSKMDGKFPMFGLLDKAGETLNSTITEFSKKYSQSNAKGIKRFFIDTTKKAADKILQYGKVGLAETETNANAFCKNAIQKGISNLAGVGAAGLTIASRYKDEDGNGIPDKAEKVLSTAKEVMEIIPAFYTAIS